MRLNADGKKRLAAMKKALATGLPLAGLLAGTLQAVSATEASAAPGGMLGAPIPPSEVRSVRPPVGGDRPTAGSLPVKPPVEKPAEPSAEDEDSDKAREEFERNFPGDLPLPPPP